MCAISLVRSVLFCEDRARKKAKPKTFVAPRRGERSTVRILRDRMEVYLCKTWQEEGSKTEEEHLDDLLDKNAARETRPWIQEFRLDLQPQGIPEV